MIFVYVPYHQFDLFALIQEKGVSSSIKTWSVWVCSKPHIFAPHHRDPPKTQGVTWGGTQPPPPPPNQFPQNHWGLHPDGRAIGLVLTLLYIHLNRCKQRSQRSATIQCSWTHAGDCDVTTIYGSWFITTNFGIYQNHKDHTWPLQPQKNNETYSSSPSSVSQWVASFCTHCLKQQEQKMCEHLVINGLEHRHCHGTSRRVVRIMGRLI